ncbi:MAG: 3-beta hydroxysteroid dehydrogenase [Deltaproteobacteria bacterium]|nr:3-beta hydroxysteroid dehydrogenase [Deltaproteobacteria bacterium]
MKYLVTGGGGFLGSAIVRQLLERGDQVCVVGRSSYPHIEKIGAQCFQIDLSVQHDLRPILEGIDVVIHTAAKAGVWGKKEEYWRINVDGTNNLLQASKAVGISKFVHTSSPSAVWNGGDEINLSEQDCPYPTTFLSHYPHSKAEAEKLVLAENCNDFHTTALRPHLIWGPEDPHLVPRILERAHRLRIVGDGTNKVGICYVENAAYAHILAADALSQEANNAGKAYFITDLEPVVLWEWINNLLVSLNKPPITRTIPLFWAQRIGGLLEWVWNSFSLSGEPMMTRFVARQLASSHYYNLSGAIQDFGYKEHTLPEDGMKQTLAYFSRS